MAADHSIPSLTSLADLAASRLGGRAIATSDDFFAPASNLLKPEPPRLIPGKFTARGKWMDGWESRRRRGPGQDWCVIALGMRGVIRGVNIDTTHFSGNHPTHCSIDGTDATDATTRLSPVVFGADGPPWTNVLRKVEISGNSEHLFAIDDERPWTHVRLNIHPDGGVARLRVYGQAAIDWPRIARAGRSIDLAAILRGGLVIGASDMHFGVKDNLVMPGRARNMGDGWETRRRRGPGHDWAIVRLGAPGVVRRVEIDTNYFKGNFPESASLDGCLAPGADLDAVLAASWVGVLPRTKLRGHHRHIFSRALRLVGAISHVRLNIFPDGGVSRLRVYGTIAPS